MKFFSFVLVFVSTFRAAHAQAPPRAVDLQSPLGTTQCGTQILKWDGGTPPYKLRVLDGNAMNAPPLVDLGTVTGDEFRWANIKLKFGTVININIEDATGDQDFTGALVIQGNEDTPDDCLTLSSSGSASGSASASGTSPSPTGAASKTGPLDAFWFLAFLPSSLVLFVF